ncbi:MAG TPA: hypothetical protein VFZ83_04725 [Acidimicrobiia bacterium]|nr:hypothetical protein [Acidimicrobiia bacterium]
MRRARALVVVAVMVSVLGACSGDGGDAAEPTSTTAAVPATPIVFNGQGNDLAAYSTEAPFDEQLVIEHNSEENPDGLDINGQICFDPDDPQRFVAGEDTFQSTTGEPGWGVFALTGTTIGELSATQVAELVPTYQPDQDGAENFGCGFLADGRIVTTDIGNQATGDPNGQLIVWFPPFEGDDIAYCKVDVAIGTAQAILVDGDAVYVASARGGGVFRYDVTTFPNDETPTGGCDSTDVTGAPLASGIERDEFIVGDETNGIATAAGIARNADGNLFVSSVFNGVISEFSSDGTFVRRVLEPPEGEALGEEPYSTGTPLGIGVASDGTLYYADLGIVISADGIGPGPNTGTVRRIRFVDGEPQPPEILGDGLAFPDGIGIYEP